MNRQDIIEMIAKVYGVAWTSEAQLKDLERFAALVASAEREACVQIVENEAMQYAEPVWAFEIVNDIKARGDVATNDTSQKRVDKTSEIVHEPVCDKDPQGCWNVRCQLGKKCKNTPPQRTWVGLTEEEKDGKRVLENGLLFNTAEVQVWELAVQWAEEKLKERNS